MKLFPTCTLYEHFKNTDNLRDGEGRVNERIYLQWPAIRLLDAVLEKVLKLH